MNDPPRATISPNHSVKTQEKLRNPSRTTLSNQARNFHSGTVIPSLSHAQSGPWTHLHLGDRQPFGFAQTRYVMEQPHRQTTDHQTDHRRRLHTTVPASALPSPSHQRPPEGSKVSFPSQNRGTVIHHHRQRPPPSTNIRTAVSFPNRDRCSLTEGPTPNLAADIREFTHRCSKGEISPQQLETMLHASLQNSLASMSLRKLDGGVEAAKAPAANQSGGRMAESERYQCTVCFKAKKTRSQLKYAHASRLPLHYRSLPLCSLLLPSPLFSQLPSLFMNVREADSFT